MQENRRQDKTGHDRKGKMRRAIRDKTRQGKYNKINATSELHTRQNRPNKARQGKARHGKTRQDKP